MLSLNQLTISLGLMSSFLWFQHNRVRQGGHKKVITNLRHLHLKMQVFHKK